MFEEFGPLTLLLVGVIFILFFLAFRKALSVVKNAAMISIAAIVFPFFILAPVQHIVFSSISSSSPTVSFP